MTDKHAARPTIDGWKSVPGIDHPVAVYSETCADCGKPVRRMSGLRIRGSAPVFWHAAPKPGPDDPRRQSPRRQDWGDAIGQGMRDANARRTARREEKPS